MTSTEAAAIKCASANCSRYLRVPVGSTADKAGKRQGWLKLLDEWHCDVHAKSVRRPEASR